MQVNSIRLFGIAPRNSIHDQDLNLVPWTSVAENIFLGQEIVSTLGFVDHARQRPSGRIDRGKLTGIDLATVERPLALHAYILPWTLDWISAMTPRHCAGDRGQTRNRFGE